MLEKIKNKYGKDLPGKSAFRNDQIGRAHV